MARKRFNPSTSLSRHRALGPTEVLRRSSSTIGKSPVPIAANASTHHFANTSTSPVCGKIPSGQCFKRGHLVVCEKHNNQHNPRNACVKCQGEEERAALAEIEERAAAAQKPPTPDPWKLEKERKKAKKEQRKSKSKRRSSTGN